MASVRILDQVPGAGIEPAASAFRARRHYHQQLPRIREGGFEPPPPDSKSGSLPVSRFPRAPRGSRTRLSDLGSPRLTARPGTHQRLQRERDRGVEPRSPGWKPGVVPLDQSRKKQAEGEGVEPSRLIARPGSGRVPSPIGLSFRLLSSGGRTRTCVPPVNSRVLVPARTPPESKVQTVGMAGFEPAISCSQGRRIGQAFLHPESSRSPTSAQRESNPHVRHGKAVGYRYIMGTITAAGLSRSREHRVGLEPSSPPYESGVFAARRPVQCRHRSGTGETRTLTEPVKSRTFCR